MTNYARAGRAREHRVALDMAKYGVRQIMRAAGSKGSADLLMVSDLHGLALVQVGTRNKTLGPAARKRFVADAADASALPLLAVTTPGVGVRYWWVTNMRPSSWHEVFPDD